VNLFLTRRCQERCAFCYGKAWLREADPQRLPNLERLLEALRSYAALVERAPPLPPWRPDQDELTRSLHSSRVVNLMGGEPTLHPAFEQVVHEIRALGLGIGLFTNASQPELVRRVKEQLWSVTVNARFAARAPALGVDPLRLYANLALSPADDVRAQLNAIHAAGPRVLLLAFATPAGQEGGRWYTPEDLDEMRQVHEQVRVFCRRHDISLAYECSFPICVAEDGDHGRCSSVPVMDDAGWVTICGGAYFDDSRRRHISSFPSLEALHRHSLRRLEALRAQPSPFARCRTCPHFGPRCHGMCLAYRQGGVYPHPSNVA